MPVYSCPHGSHRGKPVPLAETANDVFTCMAKHKFVLENDPDIGKVLREMASGILHEMSPFDMVGAAYTPEQHYAKQARAEKKEEMDIVGEITPIAEEVELTHHEAHGDDAAPAPAVPAQKKVRTISMSSILHVMPDLNLNKVSLSPAEWKIFARINGRDNIKDVIQASKVEEKEALKLLAGMIKRKLVGTMENE
jgi:hypothetical protein